MTEIEVPTASRPSRDVGVCLFLLAFGTVCGLLLSMVVETGVFAYGEYHASNGSAVLLQLTGDSIQPVVDALLGAAKTGNIGDGKIFVYSLEEAYRIRTGETGADAL